jgi:hypothetical protein
MPLPHTWRNSLYWACFCSYMENVACLITGWKRILTYTMNSRTGKWWSNIPTSSVSKTVTHFQQHFSLEAISLLLRLCFKGGSFKGINLSAKYTNVMHCIALYLYTCNVTISQKFNIYRKGQNKIDNFICTYLLWQNIYNTLSYFSFECAAQE